jgi:prolyl 4-hydroxylase
MTHLLVGECEKNPSYMKLHCAPVCQTCEYVSYDYRCPRDESIPDALSQPGDLNRLFQRIVDDQYFQEQYTPIVLSSPETTNGPWVIQFDNFVSHEECERLIELGNAKGYGNSVSK